MCLLPGDYIYSISNFYEARGENSNTGTGTYDAFQFLVYGWRLILKLTIEEAFKVV